MRGTLISTDFIKDSSGNYKFLEMNTDAGIHDEFISNHLDLSSLINLLSGSTPQIDTFEVVYKPLIADNFVEHLSSSLAVSASFITSFVKHEEDIDTIYPSSPTDGDNKFILRLAYDENAILDSTYAKNDIEPLKLFNDNASSNAVDFYYSSSYGDGTLEINTLSKTTNSSTLPDLVNKVSTTGTLTSVSFVKLISGSSDTEKVDLYLSESANTIVTNFHIHSDTTTDGVVQSVKSFSIIYGSSLSSIHLGCINGQAILELPTSLTLNTTDAFTSAKILADKHYHEFSTSTRKEREVAEVLFETENLISQSGESLHYTELVSGSVLKSYHIDGLPDSDDINVFGNWSMEGYTFSGNSAETSSVVQTVSSASLGYPELIQIKVSGDDEYRYIHPSANVLAYSTSSNEMKFVKAGSLDSTDNFLVNTSGSLMGIEESNRTFFNTLTGSTYVANIETSDILLTDGDTLGMGFMLHNIFICFVAGTKISLSNGDVKNIEDIVVGDSVISFNEETGEKESKEVTEIFSPIHDDLITITFSNGVEVTCTYDHPFYVNGLNLSSYRPKQTLERYEFDREVGKLKEGDILKDVELNEVSVVSIKELDREKTQTYIFTVEDNHNFFANGLLTHNKME